MAQSEKRPAELTLDKEPPAKKKPVRIFTDGCFDMLHFGHCNALRQAKALGDELVVGIHSDEDIAKHKGPPIMNMKERVTVLRANKWVTEIVENAPYVTQLSVMDEYNCDYCAHGDDLIYAADGTFCYQAVADADRFKTFKRTAGISTTDLVGRMLLMTKTHFVSRTDPSEDHEPVTTPMKKTFSEFSSSGENEVPTISPYTAMHRFLPTSKKIIQFSEGMAKEPQPSDTVVYCPGDFDLMHAGQVGFLEKCLEIGNYIIVGLHEDAVVNSYKGGNFPIMNLHERVLGVLSCKYVSDVVIGAPYSVTDDLLDYFKVDAVVHGRTPIKPCPDGSNPYEAAIKRGIFHQITTDSTLTTNDVVLRIINNRLRFEERNKKKQQREVEAIDRQNSLQSH